MCSNPCQEKNYEYVLPFCTGTSYIGALDAQDKMTGFGTYRFPNRTEYRGHFINGFFHGRGMIIDKKSNFKMCGYFINGKCDNYDVFFGDGLEFKEDNWKYCSQFDRRFWIEINEGIPPVGETFLTKEKPSRAVPPGHYDVEEGFYDSTSGYIVDALSGEKIRYVFDDEKEKILQNCRMNQNDFEMKYKLDENMKEETLFTDSFMSSDGE